MADYYLNEQVPECHTSIYERGTSRRASLTEREACDLLNAQQAEIERLAQRVAEQNKTIQSLTESVLHERNELRRIKAAGGG